LKDRENVTWECHSKVDKKFYM